MIDSVWIQGQIAECDARLAHLDAGRELLEQLRAKYVVLLEIHTNGAEAVREGRTSADQAEERGFDSRPPLQSQPGSARSGQRERRRPGRRAPAAAAAPSTSSSGPVGTPTPASSVVACRECGEEVKAKGLGVHRAKSERHAEAIAGATPAKPQPLGADVDRRNIDELCTRGCGRRFRWEPSLLSHIRSCDGKPQAEPGGGYLHDLAGGCRLERMTAVAA